MSEGSANKWPGARERDRTRKTQNNRVAARSYLRPELVEGESVPFRWPWDVTCRHCGSHGVCYVRAMREDSAMREDRSSMQREAETREEGADWCVWSLGPALPRAWFYE